MFASLRDTASRTAGHAWTIGPKIGATLRPPTAPDAAEWRQQADDAGHGPIYVTGRWRPRPDSDTCVVVVHGLGGCADSDYCIDTARVVDEHGYACLRLSLRGANRGGDDIYHGGLYRDVEAALTSPELRDYNRCFVVGFSLGGHIALRSAIELDCANFAGAAAICSPLDLGAGQHFIDAPDRWMYREYLLFELRRLYSAVARRGRSPTPVERVRQTQTLREWDALTVVPRFGFRDVDDYYERASVAGDLDRLSRPALLVASRRDPLIPPAAIEPALGDGSDQLTVRWSDRGGHVYFPRELDLGFDGPRGLVSQVLADLESRTSASE